MRACSSNASTVAGFATSTTWNSVSSRSGVASTRTSLTEQFDSGVFDYTRVCPYKQRPLWAQTVTDVFVYKLLRWLFHIGNFCFWVPFLKQLLLRNCAVDFVEICNIYIGKMIITAANLILIRHAVVIVIWILASLFLEHSVCNNLPTVIASQFAAVVQRISRVKQPLDCQSVPFTLHLLWWSCGLRDINNVIGTFVSVSNIGLILICVAKLPYVNRPSTAHM